MKKTIAIILAAVMMLGLLAGCSSDSESLTLEEGKLIMSTNAAFPPYEMTTDSGDFEGIDIEVAAAIAEARICLECRDHDDFLRTLSEVEMGLDHLKDEEAVRWENLY